MTHYEAVAATGVQQNTCRVTTENKDVLLFDKSDLHHAKIWEESQNQVKAMPGMAQVVDIQKEKLMHDKLAPSVSIQLAD